MKEPEYECAGKLNKCTNIATKNDMMQTIHYVRRFISVVIPLGSGCRKINVESQVPSRGSWEEMGPRCKNKIEWTG